jgi:hypothetical protein
VRRQRAGYDIEHDPFCLFGFISRVAFIWVDACFFPVLNLFPSTFAPPVSEVRSDGPANRKPQVADRLRSHIPKP